MPGGFGTKVHSSCCIFVRMLGFGVILVVIALIVFPISSLLHNVNLFSLGQLFSLIWWYIRIVILLWFSGVLPVPVVVIVPVIGIMTPVVVIIVSVVVGPVVPSLDLVILARCIVARIHHIVFIQ